MGEAVVEDVVEESEAAGVSYEEAKEIAVQINMRTALADSLFGLANVAHACPFIDVNRTRPWDHRHQPASRP